MIIPEQCDMITKIRYHIFAAINSIGKHNW